MYNRDFQTMDDDPSLGRDHFPWIILGVASHFIYWMLGRSEKVEIHAAS